MSIITHIAELEADGKLRRFTPRSRRPCRRRLYLSPVASALLDNPSSPINLLVGRGYVEASFTRWVLGDRVYGDQRKARFLARLCPPPPEVWEIRVTEPVIQGRIFARFAEADTLVITGAHTRSYLGAKGSREWKRAMDDSVATWQQLFPEHLPFECGDDIHCYVTENCDDFPIKC